MFHSHLFIYFKINMWYELILSRIRRKAYDVDVRFSGILNRFYYSWECITALLGDANIFCSFYSLWQTFKWFACYLLIHRFLLWLEEFIEIFKYLESYDQTRSVARSKIRVWYWEICRIRKMNKYFLGKNPLISNTSLIANYSFAD